MVLKVHRLQTYANASKCMQMQANVCKCKQMYANGSNAMQMIAKITDNDNDYDNDY